MEFERLCLWRFIMILLPSFKTITGFLFYWAFVVVASVVLVTPLLILSDPGAWMAKNKQEQSRSEVTCPLTWYMATVDRRGPQEVLHVTVSCDERSLRGIPEDLDVYVFHRPENVYEQYEQQVAVFSQWPSARNTNPQSFVSCTRHTWTASRWFGHLLGYESDRRTFTTYEQCRLAA
jgi:hypothetical protein